MENFEKLKENALKAYSVFDGAVKAMLENLPKHNVVSGNIMQRTNSFLAACKITGDNPEDARFHIGPIHLIAQNKLEVICKALCEGVILTYRDCNQKKWYPWMKWDEASSGFRFGVAHCAYTTANAALGSRLQVDTEEKAKYLGTHPEFVILLNQLLINHENETIR
jgi:hypothetical protein